MKVIAHHRYNADVDTVFALFHDPDFHRRKFAACGAKKIAVSTFKADGAALEFTIKREVPANNYLVGDLTIVGKWTTVVQKEHWGGDPGERYWNEFDVHARGTPITMTGKMNLRGDGDSCINDIEIDLHSPVPVVGHVVERLAAKEAESSLQKECEFLTAELLRAPSG